MSFMSPEYEKWTITVKKALLDRKITTTILAKQMGECRPNLSALLNGRYVSEPMIRRVSEYLGINCPGEDESTA